MRKNTNPCCYILIATQKELLGLQLAVELDRPDCHVVTAKDGNSVVDFCHENEDIQVLIIDSDLPGLNGYETIRQIRQSGKSEMIIILLAWFSIHAMQMACEIGCNELFAKPVQHMKLVGFLRSHLSI